VKIAAQPSAGPPIDLGVPGLAALPELQVAPEKWRELAARLSSSRFLHSEGFATPLGTPQRASPELMARSHELVARFNRFYEHAIDSYYAERAPRAEYLWNPLFDRPLAIDRATPIGLPLSRLDCVLTDDDQMRVVELNAPGVCTLHLRSALYLSIMLRRAGFEESARLLDWLGYEQVSSFRRFYQAQQPAEPKESPRIGLVFLPAYHRGTRVVWRELFCRYGFRWSEGTLADVEITRDALKVRGEPVDILWGDLLFHLGYQYVRYRETTWKSKLGDFSVAPEQTRTILDDPRVLELIASRRLVNITPVKSYLAMAKSLLAWIHRPDRPVPEEDRRWLAEHVARTYSALDRSEGAIAQSEVIARREAYLLKPCQYGGGHGVLIGRTVEPGEWARRVEATWSDPSWVVQDFYLPRRAPSGEWTSFGLYNYGGRMGGIALRTDPSLLIGARTAAFVPVL
jgi:hypothetical protein